MGQAVNAPNFVADKSQTLVSPKVSRKGASHNGQGHSKIRWSRNPRLCHVRQCYQASLVIYVNATHRLRLYVVKLCRCTRKCWALIMNEHITVYTFLLYPPTISNDLKKQTLSSAELYRAERSSDDVFQSDAGCLRDRRSSNPVSVSRASKWAGR